LSNVRPDFRPGVARGEYHRDADKLGSVRLDRFAAVTIFAGGATGLTLGGTMPKPRVSLAALGLVVCLLLSACTFTDDLTGQIRRDTDSIQTATEKALLLNIVRSGYGEPISFTQVANVLATGAVNGTLGLPFALFGPGPTPPTLTQNGFGLAGNNAVNASSGNNVSLSVLDTKEFWLGMLTPLSFDTLNFFISQGVPRDVLFALYLQKQIVATGDKITTYNNDPNDPHFADFVGLLRRNLQLGLTTQSLPRAMPVGPPIDAVAASNLKQLVKTAQAGMLLIPVKTKEGLRYQLLNGKISATLCFDPTIATIKVDGQVPKQFTCPAVMESAMSAVAKEQAGGAGQLTAAFQAMGFAGSATPGSVGYTLYPRSTYGIIRYLGATAKAALDNPAYNALANSIAQQLGRDPIGTRLFYIEKNAPPSSDDFVSVTYRGDRYSIPMKATTTVQVLGLVQQLIALSTSVNSLPVSGTVVTAR
jgi:hypothetical protein